MTGNPGDAGYDPTTQGMPVNILTGAGDLNANIIQLDADIKALDADIKLLITAVNANTAKL
jgi:hypothetical protein